MVAAHDAEIVIESENSRSCGAGGRSKSSGTKPAGIAIKTTRDGVTRTMRKPGEHLHANVTRPQPRCFEICVSLGRSNAIGSHMECIHDVRSKQVRVADSERLRETGFPGLNG